MHVGKRAITQENVLISKTQLLEKIELLVQDHPSLPGIMPSRVSRRTNIGKKRFEKEDIPPSSSNAAEPNANGEPAPVQSPEQNLANKEGDVVKQAAEFAGLVPSRKPFSEGMKAALSSKKVDAIADGITNEVGKTSKKRQLSGDANSPSKHVATEGDAQETPLDNETGDGVVQSKPINLTVDKNGVNEDNEGILMDAENIENEDDNIFRDEPEG